MKGDSEGGGVSDEGAKDPPPSVLRELKDKVSSCLGTKMGTFPVGIESGGLTIYLPPAGVW